EGLTLSAKVGAHPSPTFGHKSSRTALNSVLCQGAPRKLPLLATPPFLEVLQNVRRNCAKHRIPVLTMTNCLHIKNIAFVKTLWYEPFRAFQLCSSGQATEP